MAGNQNEDNKAREEELKNSGHLEKYNERDQLQISQKNLDEEEKSVPTEYLAINLTNLIYSQNQ